MRLAVFLYIHTLLLYRTGDGGIFLIHVRLSEIGLRDIRSVALPATQKHSETSP